MTCSFPRQAGLSKFLKPNGSRIVTLSAALYNHPGYSPISLPCRKCMSCRLERSRQWAVRCMHEAQSHEKTGGNCFITLTFDNKYLPPTGSLNLRLWQDFMSRYRKRFGNGIKYFHCGEYGSKNDRPHYHALLFNTDLPDKVEFKKVGGHQLYTSSILESLWPFGFSTVGSVTFDSARYVAKYCTKTVTGKAARQHYERVRFDPDSGELLAIDHLKPEYATMSNGIGREWYERNKLEVYDHDCVVVKGTPQRPPSYYDSLFQIDNPDDYAIIKANRILAASLVSLSPEEKFRKGYDREKCLTARFNLQSLTL